MKACLSWSSEEPRKLEVRLFPAKELGLTPAAESAAGEWVRHGERVPSERVRSADQDQSDSAYSRPIQCRRINSWVGFALLKEIVCHALDPLAAT